MLDGRRHPGQGFLQRHMPVGNDQPPGVPADRTWQCKGDGDDRSDVAGVGSDRSGACLRRIHRRHGVAEYAGTAGNLGAQMWTRDLDDGRTEVLTVSWWESRAAIEGFAGSDIDVAVFYPEDDEYLVDRETTVLHYEVPRFITG